MTAGAAWTPPPDALETTNVGQFMQAHGIATFAELRQRSVKDPQWFWSAVVDHLGIGFADPYEQVLDTSDGIEWARWFTGGTLNLADICVDRWAADPEMADATAVVWEGEDGEIRTWTYSELRSEADALAFLLAGRGVGVGDAVGVYCP